MKLAVLKETRPLERRVAATPDTIKKYVGLGFEVLVEAGSGSGASIPDSVFEAAGARIVPDGPSASREADVVLKVQAPAPEDLGNYKKGALLIALLSPLTDPKGIKAYADAGLIAFSLELIPRISRAQSMDVLSSQSNLAGYKAVVEAASVYGRAMPMMMTAAGTVAAARVMVLGAGVAGLQAIATARRLGAIVSATDVRPAAKEQVESLGAKFVMVESEETKQAETAGGYAKEMSEDYKRAQAKLVAETLAKQDIAITTALIPGRPAPKLIDDDMVKSMKPGSVIVDLAVEMGGNCTLSKPGEVIEVGGVTIIGHLNMPSRIAVDASTLYAKNILNFLSLMVDAEAKALAINWDDEIIKGTALTRDGQIIHPQFAANGGQ